MDFSSTERALQSLLRRNPALSEDVLEAADRLLQFWTEKDSEKDPNVVQQTLVSLLQAGTTTDRWEPLAVSLYVITGILDQQMLENAKEKGASLDTVYVDGPRVPQVASASSTNAAGSSATIAALLASSNQLDTLATALLVACRGNLTHNEPRVRTLVAKAVGTFVRFVLQQSNEGLLVPALQLHDSIVDSLRDHLKQGRDESNADTHYSASSTGALDDTTGWRALETNWQGLASYVAAMGGSYYDHHELTAELLEMCEHSCIKHLNRHVRAAGIATLEQWILAVAARGKESDDESLLQPDSILWTSVVKVLKETLADNWSQVRMAGSVLCRTFWVTILSRSDTLPSDWRSTLTPTLIPRMCLNRFYLAQGVKLYSHETWKLVFEEPGSGLECVASVAGAVSRYYVKMCDADNHAVREAACQAVAELATKLGAHAEYKDALAPYVPLLLQALLMCFHDESWPVRDEAALACGSFCKAFPEESRPELPTLMERWTEQLTDQIWSVRQDAAVALADAVVAYGDAVFEKLLALLKEKLPSAREQPAMTMEEYKQRQNDIQSHTDSQLYSCGSLAPKLRKGGAGRIGCSSCGITRPKSPWEATDGCIYLLQELMTHCPEVGDDVWLPLVTQLADVCRVRHFPQGDDLRTTLWRQLPLMANALGKQRFKRQYLALFLDLLMSDLESRTASALSKHAAGQCAEELARLVGVSIFRGRLDDYQQEAFDRTMRERQQMPKGPASADGFSPFGPPGLLDESPPGMATDMGPTRSPFSQMQTPVPGSGFTDSL